MASYTVTGDGPGGVKPKGPTGGDSSETVLRSDYAKRKDFAQGVLDFSMFLTSVTQLKILMQMPEEKQDTLWTAILAFVILTMIFQVILGLLLLQLRVLNSNPTVNPYRKLGTECCVQTKWTLDRINNVALFVTFFIFIFNALITGLGIDYSGSFSNNTN